MTPAERRALGRLRTAAARSTPELEAALAEAFAELLRTISVADFERALRSGALEAWLREALGAEVVWQAFGPVRERLAQSVTRAGRLTLANARQVPRAPSALIGVSFDSLAPQVVEAVRTLQTEVITRLGDEMRESVRQRVLAGIEAGENPRTTARALREVLQLSPRQEAAIRNYRAALENGERGKALSYALRSKQYDAATRKGTLTPAQIDRATEAYRRRMVAYNAETTARTAALESQKLGQGLAWQEAQASGALEGSRVIATWVAILDDRVRDSHETMHHAEREIDGEYRNGDAYPGQSEPWNCRCGEVFKVVRADYVLQP